MTMDGPGELGGGRLLNAVNNNVIEERDKVLLQVLVHVLCRPLKGRGRRFSQVQLLTSRVAAQFGSDCTQTHERLPVNRNVVGSGVERAFMKSTHSPSGIMPWA